MWNTREKTIPKTLRIFNVRFQTSDKLLNNLWDSQQGWDFIHNQAAMNSVKKTVVLPNTSNLRRDIWDSFSGFAVNAFGRRLGPQLHS